MAVFCALVALLALAAGVARHLRSYRHDVASLRVLGVGLGAARRAGRVELVTLAVVVVLAVAAGGVLAVQLLLDGLPLVTLSPAALPLDTAPNVLTLIAACGARCDRDAGHRWPGPRRTPRLDPALDAPRGGGTMISPHDLLLLRCAPPNNVVGTPR